MLYHILIFKSINVHSAVYLDHFAAQAVGDIQTLFGGQFVYVLFEEIVLQVDLFDKEFGVKNIGLIHIDVDSVVACQGGIVDIILDGSDIVVDKEFFAENIAGEASDAVIYGDYIRIEAGDKVIQGIQRRYSAAGRNVYIHAEGGDRVIGVIFGEGVDSHMALIEVSVDHLGGIGELTEVAGGIDGILIQFLFSDKHIDRRALRLIILFGDIEDTGTDHFGYVAEYLGKTLGVILFVDIFDIVLLLLLTLCVANVVDIKAKGLSEVIEAVKGDLFILQSIIYPFGVIGAKPVKSGLCGSVHHRCAVFEQAQIYYNTFFLKSKEMAVIIHNS